MNNLRSETLYDAFDYNTELKLWQVWKSGHVIGSFNDRISAEIYIEVLKEIKIQELYREAL